MKSHCDKPGFSLHKFASLFFTLGSGNSPPSRGPKLKILSLIISSRRRRCGGSNQIWEQARERLWASRLEKERNIKWSWRGFLMKTKGFSYVENLRHRSGLPAYFKRAKDRPDSKMRDPREFLRGGRWPNRELCTINKLKATANTETNNGGSSSWAELSELWP